MRAMHAQEKNSVTINKHKGIMIFMYRIDLLPDGCFVLTTHHKFPLKSV